MTSRQRLACCVGQVTGDAQPWKLSSSLAYFLAAGIGFAIQHGKKKEAARTLQQLRGRLASKYSNSPLRDDILSGTIRPA
jgi:hypothetical protein